MAYLVIENFAGGVDRRRPIYAAKPGTLWACENGHVTMGGDVEKRKAFADQGAFDADTFGLFALADNLYTFGNQAASGITVPSGVTYQFLQYPNAPMTALLDADLFDGKIYVIASFGDGFVGHFYDGALIDDWYGGIVLPFMSNMAGVATALAANIDGLGALVATAAGQVITVTSAVAGVPFTVTTLALNGGNVDDQTMVSANVTPNTVGVAATSATASFSVTGGAGAGSVSSIRVGGVEILNVAVNWATSDTNFATLIAAQINAFASTPEYTAVASNSTVIVTASTAGTAANGLRVEGTSTGTVLLGGQVAAGTSLISTMAGGVAAIAAVAQVNTLTLGGTFDPGDRFGIITVMGGASPATLYSGNAASPWGRAACVKTHKRKLYAGAGSILQFCKVNDPLSWNVDTDAGAGFLNASTHDGGSETVLSLEVYQGRLAVFSRHAIQLWTMQNDDDLNNLDQVLRNTGTRSPRSTQEFAGNDVFYLDDAGIRSLRARDASNNAFGSGVGGPINAMVRDWMRDDASPSEVVNARSVVEPQEARFWMSIGERIFVYSYFPETQVAAWSWYTPGFVVDDFAVAANRIYARANNRLYLYGGESGDEYGSDYEVTVELPFTTAKKPGTFKAFTGMDMAAEGEWSCQWRIDPNELARVVQMGTYDGVTFPKADWDGVGDATHIAPVMTHQGTGRASLSVLALYYDGQQEAG